MNALGFIVTFALLAALVATAWSLWRLLMERVRCSERELVKLGWRRREAMALADIARIDFHYHAVVGFVSAWEFVSRSGRSLHVSGDAHGIDAVLRALERYLPGFSIAAFKRELEAGDVEDTIEVWRVDPPYPRIGLQKHE